MQFGLQFVIVARFRGVTAPYGIDLILQYHRQIAFVAGLLMVVHPLILLVRTPRLVVLLNPFGGTPASRWGMVSLLAFVALMLTSLFRQRLRLSYEWWRGLHILFLEVVHVLEQPPAEWNGEKGWITAEVLRRVLPKERISRAFFVCGPGPMTDAVEQALLGCGIPSRSIHMERFDLV